MSSSDILREAARRRKTAIWPPAPPFDERDVVVCFRTREDAERFSWALAYADAVEIEIKQ